MAADGGDSVARWYSASELAGLPGLPSTKQNVTARGKRDAWESRRREARGGGREFAFSALPPTTQAALLLRERASAPHDAEPRQASGARWTKARIAAVWDDYNRATEKRREIAYQRVLALRSVEGLHGNGMLLMRARDTVSQQFGSEGQRGMSAARLAHYAKLVDGAPRDAWAAVLLPKWCGRTATAACDPRAWEWYRQQWLTRKAPGHEDTYRRLEDIAKVEAWAIPSAKTMVRRCEELAPYTVCFYRKGPEAAARMLPPQKRDALVFAAGEAVNGDGLKFDKLWIKFDDGEILNTATAWLWQDIRTRKILAWRLGKTENTDLFRLATYDLTGICAPAHAWMDNTRVAANKVMTGGAKGRHRFKDQPGDGLGMLQMLDIEPHFTNPDKELGMPGAKPIERAFGLGGIHGMVAANPQFRDRGYSRATAIGEQELREVISEEVARYNARTKRRTQACGGVLSFDQAWQEGLKLRTPRVLVESQRQVLLMSREIVRPDNRSGIVTLKAGRNDHGVNSYWSEDLPRYMGRQLMAMFDPDDLSAGIHLYALDGTYLLEAEHRPSAAYNSTDAGREHQKRKQRILKGSKRVAAEERGLDAHVKRHTRLPHPEDETSGGNVVEGHFKRTVNPERDADLATGTDGDGGVTKLDEWSARQSLKLWDRLI